MTIIVTGKEKFGDSETQSRRKPCNDEDRE